MHAIVPQTSIKQIIKDNEKSIAKPVNPSQVVADLNHEARSNKILQEEDPMMFDLITGNNDEEEVKEVINIVINNGSYEQQVNDMKDDALFDFDDLPSIQDSQNKRAKVNDYDEANCRKNIKGRDKSYSRMNRDVVRITKS